MYFILTWRDPSFWAMWVKVQNFGTLGAAVTALAFFVTKWLNWGIFPLWVFIIWICILAGQFYSAYELRKFAAETSETSEPKDLRDSTLLN